MEIAACTVAGAAALLVLGVVLWAAAYARPVADDFARAAVDDWPEYIFKDMYLAWSGRWASIGLAAAILPRVDLPAAYPGFIVVLGALQLLAFAAFAGILTNHRIRPFAGLLLFALVWSGMPGTGSGFYWFTGHLENQLPVSLALLLFFGVQLRIRSGASGWKGRLANVGLAALAFVIPGMHELSGLALCVVLAAFAAVSRAAGRRHPVLLVVFAAAVAGFIVTFMAPGNAVRAGAGDFPNREDLRVMLRLAWSQAAAALPGWILDPKLLFASLWLLLRPGARSASWVHSPSRWLVPAFWAGLIAMEFAAPGWAIGNLMPERTLGTIYTLFVIGWFASVMACAGGASICPGREGLRAGASVAAAAGFGLSLLITGNTPAVYRALQTNAPRWHAAELRNDRLAAEARAAGTRNVTLPYAPVSPFFIMDEPVKPDPSAFPNRDVAAYYGLASIRMSEPAWEAVDAWDFRRNPPGPGIWTPHRSTVHSGDTGWVFRTTVDLDYLVIGTDLNVEVNGTEMIEAEVVAWHVAGDGERTEVMLEPVVVFYAPPRPPGKKSDWPFSADENVVLQRDASDAGRYRAPAKGKKGWSGVQGCLLLSVKTGPLPASARGSSAHFEIHLKSLRILRPAE